MPAERDAAPAPVGTALRDTAPPRSAAQPPSADAQAAGGDRGVEPAMQDVMAQPSPAARSSHAVRGDAGPRASASGPHDPPAQTFTTTPVRPAAKARAKPVAAVAQTPESNAPRQRPVALETPAGAQFAAATGQFIWNELPPGFSDLAETQTSIVDVYFHGRKIASTLAKFAPGWVRFENPREIAEKLPNEVDRDRVTEALTGELASNAALVCTEPPKPGCGELQPRVAGVIFDRDRFRADLFVHPSLLPVQGSDGPTYLPDPNSGFSALQSFAAVYSGGTVSDEQYNVQSFTLLGMDKTRLRAQTGVSDTDGFGVSTLVGEHERRDQIYRGGLYRSAPVPVLGDRPFYGVGYSSTYKARLDLEQIRGSELVVFLPRPAQVDVFREGRLISSQSFEGGNQVIDTSTFPAGAYDVLLRIKESGGAVREERRFFAKTDQVPPAKAPRYIVEAGVLGGDAQNPFPKTDTDPLLHAGTTHRLLDEVALGGDVVVSSEGAAFSAEAFYLNPYVTLSLGGFWATDSSAGTRFSANGRLKNFSYGFGARYFMTDASPNDISITSTGSGGFTQLDMNLGYSFTNGPRIGFRGFWRDSDVADQTYSYGPTLYWTAYRKRRMRIDLISDATFSDTESLAMARLRFSYDDNQFHFDASAGYRAALRDDSTGSDGLLANINGEWRKQDFLDGELRLGAGAETQPRADVTRANAKYIGPRGQVNSFVQQDLGNDHDTRYGGNLLFNVLGNSETVTMGGAHAFQSAIIVTVDGDAKAEFDVLINGQPKGRVAAGQTLPFMLPDYKTYSVRLKAVGAPAVAYDTRTRHVSLYPATVKTLRWTAEPIVTLFARIVDADGQPIADARVEGGVETSYTDRNGYFQVDLARVAELRVVRSGWDDCAVTFRSLPRDREFISGKTLVCRWLSAEKRGDNPSAGQRAPAANAEERGN